MVKACIEACENDLIGYDQSRRNSLNAQAVSTKYSIKDIKVPCSADCSSLMTVCCEAAGITVPYIGSNAPTTGVMKVQFMKTGMFELLTDPMFLTTDKYLEKGDILVREGHHTVMALEDGPQTPLPTLKYGSTGPYVRKAQTLLKLKGFPIEVDSDYGSATKQAVIAFQAMANITKDGVIGPITWSKLK